MNPTQPAARDATGDGAPASSGLGAMLCPDEDIQVTRHFVLVPGEAYAVAEVEQISVGRAPCAPAGIAAALLSAAAMSALAACVAAGALLMGLLAAAATVGFGVLAGVIWHGRPHELWIRHRGRYVFLFRCQDEIRFGKVVRALQRARHP
jgi:Family of unknown function (DUF6232)